ncbi:hypothetical protein AC249_AIPGENE18765 [Exaiptasia diaphana]|nr:hypothetical protein AC249_AIPGENE18765 [Exaiptasia diaphana]
MPKKSINFKGRSPNIERFVSCCGNDRDVSNLLNENLAAGAKLAAKNRSGSLDEKTSRVYELRLMALEKFAKENGDDAILFGEATKRPFLAATIQTYLQILGEVKGKKIGSLRCRGLKPPVIKGHTAASRY